MAVTAPRRILLASTPVGPLGSGIGGGVELTLHGLALGLGGRGHHVEVVAPAGSLHVGAVTHQIAGALQVGSQFAGRDAPISMPPAPVLGAMWEWIRDHQHDFDVVLDLAYDWLPHYVAPFLHVPVAHLVSMGSLNDAMDTAIAATVATRPGSVAVHSRAQAESFVGLADRFTVVGNGIAVERYDIRDRPDDPPHLGFIGRISAEKGIADVFAVSAATGLPVKVWGVMQDPDVWQRAATTHPEARVEYAGFLATDELQAAVGGCLAVLMTPKWLEAFGNVAIEAMACGVPVIAYRRGGPAEIVVDGTTGFLVEPDDVEAMVAAVAQVDSLDREACRRHVVEHFSVEALAARVEAWLESVVAASAARVPDTVSDAVPDTVSETVSGATRATRPGTPPGWHR